MSTYPTLAAAILASVEIAMDRHGPHFKMETRLGDGGSCLFTYDRDIVEVFFGGAAQDLSETYYTIEEVKDVFIGRTVV